jgi:ribosome-associated toxin RatA of RatAB toxin-antitoxin module
MALHTENTATISAPGDVVFDLAAHIERWPRILPHYRYVRVLSASGPFERVVHMGASRDGIPVRWTSVQELDPEGGEIRYRHVEGVTRGMRVLWRIVESQGVTRVSIHHDLEPQRWWLTVPVAEYVVGRLFVEYIAGKTLAGIKRQAERISRAGQHA